MIKHLTAAIAATTLMAGAAHATPISFADEADTNGERGVPDGTVLNIGGLNISFLAGTLAGDGRIELNSFSAYLDSSSNGLPGGLGVCRVLDSDNQCDPSGDDSTDGDNGINEAVSLFFEDGPINIFGLSFRDGNHNQINDSSGLIDYAIFFDDGTNTGLVTSTFADLVALASAGLRDVLAINLGFNNTEFYLESLSDVPIPGALPLLISGLAGLGFASRKKKKAA